MHVRMPSASLSASTLKTVLPEFRALPKDQWTTTGSITDPAYAPNTWVPVQNARSNFGAELGGSSGFDRWVIDALMIDPSEAYGTHNTTAKVRDKELSVRSFTVLTTLHAQIWEKFQSTFSVSDVGPFPSSSSG